MDLEIVSDEYIEEISNPSLIKLSTSRVSNAKIPPKYKPPAQPIIQAASTQNLDFKV